MDDPVAQPATRAAVATASNVLITMWFFIARSGLDLMADGSAPSAMRCRVDRMVWLPFTGFAGCPSGGRPPAANPASDKPAAPERQPQARTSAERLSPGSAWGTRPVLLAHGRTVTKTQAVRQAFCRPGRQRAPTAAAQENPCRGLVRQSVPQAQDGECRGRGSAPVPRRNRLADSLLCSLHSPGQADT